MKRRELNALARSLGEYLASRNNDIVGYWGIGFLCSVAKQERRHQFSFRIRPGEIIRIASREISNSHTVSDKLVKFKLSGIEGRFSFFADGRYPDGVEKYTCGIAIAVTQDGRTGVHLSHIACWLHDPKREQRSTRVSAASPPAGTLLYRIQKLFG
jgi:hypothetical protein